MVCQLIVEVMWVGYGLIYVAMSLFEQLLKEISGKKSNEGFLLKGIWFDDSKEIATIKSKPCTKQFWKIENRN